LVKAAAAVDINVGVVVVGIAVVVFFICFPVPTGPLPLWPKAAAAAAKQVIRRAEFGISVTPEGEDEENCVEAEDVKEEVAELKPDESRREAGEVNDDPVEDNNSEEEEEEPLAIAEGGDRFGVF
jgi:hypothetical protein